MILSDMQFVSDLLSSAIAFYHCKKADMEPKSSVREEQYRLAAKHYFEAASCYPVDDEQHTCERSL